MADSPYVIVRREPDDDINCERRAADAHLIAAAPDLAEALEPFASLLQGNYSHQPDDMKLVIGNGPHDLRLTITLGDLRRARSALAKTRGEA